MEAYGPVELEKRVRWILGALVVMNVLAIIFLAGDVLPGDVFALRLTAGIFLMLFVCLHGWYQYGWPTMVIFFCITAAITWLVETIGLATGVPFGAFRYNDTLGIKIGEVPLMILPAYFFNGYLAWIMAGLICCGQSIGSGRKPILLVPPLAAMLMVFWNVSFEPVMSTIEGHWTWDSGSWHGVPLSNFAGWFVTSVSFFLAFTFFLRKNGEKFDSWRNNPLKPVHWFLFPVMYLVQGLPGLLHPFFRAGHASIYYSVALVTAIMMVPAALACTIVIWVSLKATAARKHKSENFSLS
jgi:uncharacterized membrane protein